MKLTELTKEDRTRMMSFLSEYLDDFILVGFDLTESPQWMLKTHSGKTSRATVSLTEDVIHIIKNGGVGNDGAQ